MNKNIISIFALIILSSCFGIFGSSMETIVDDYEIGWIDVREGRALYKQERLVPDYVFAVGYNTRFIFAMQHPEKIGSPEKIDEQITNYYLIERTNSGFHDKPIYGPLSKIEFDSIFKVYGFNIEPKFKLHYTLNP